MGIRTKMIYWVISEKGKDELYLTKYLDHIKIFSNYHRYNVEGFIKINTLTPEFNRNSKWVTKGELNDLLSL